MDKGGDTFPKVGEQAPAGQLIEAAADIGVEAQAHEIEKRPPVDRARIHA